MTNSLRTLESLISHYRDEISEMLRELKDYFDLCNIDLVYRAKDHQMIIVCRNYAGASLREVSQCFLLDVYSKYPQEVKERILIEFKG